MADSPNIHQERHRIRKNSIHQIFEINYRNSIDDFFEARDQFLEDMSEVFLEQYGANFQAFALDELGSQSRAEFRRVLKELAQKV